MLIQNESERLTQSIRNPNSRDLWVRGAFRNIKNPIQDNLKTISSYIECIQPMFFVADNDNNTQEFNIIDNTFQNEGFEVIGLNKPIQTWGTVELKFNNQIIENVDINEALCVMCINDLTVSSWANIISPQSDDSKVKVLYERSDYPNQDVEKYYTITNTFKDVKEVDCIYVNRNYDEIFVKVFTNNEKYDDNLMTKLIFKEIEVKDKYQDVVFTFSYHPSKLVDIPKIVSPEFHRIYSMR